MSALDPRRPLIVIGAPVFGTVQPAILEDWMRWAFYLGRRMPAYDFQLAIIPKKEQFRARNFIVDEARKMLADYVLMIDDDMVINHWQTFGDFTQGDEAYGFLPKLIAHDKDICGILYYQRLGGCHPVLMTKDPHGEGYRYLREDEITHGLQRVDVAGGGVLLVKMRVLDRLTPPVFAPEFTFGTDVQLCRKAAELGFEVWADTSIEVGHLRCDPEIVTSRNRAMYALSDTLPGEVKRSFDAVALYGRLVEDVCRYTGYKDIAEITQHAQAFMTRASKAQYADDLSWYRQHGRERIARQTWFNTQIPHKRQMTELMLSAVDTTQRKLRILDFGCGIGIPACFFAERGMEVVALDLQGTETLEFLKWRAKGNGLPIKILESQGGVPRALLEAEAPFDVIIAMDAVEHVEGWRELVPLLASRLNNMGALFANNAILDDDRHPEHYPVNNFEFVEACTAAGLLPLNGILYEKRTPAIPRTGTPPQKELAPC